MRIINLLVGLYLILLNSISISQEINFYQIAKHSKTINFPDEIVIGNINYLDVNNSDDLLITDRVAGEVYLFQESGNIINKVSPVSCHPGFNWRPIFSKFDKSGNILVINGGPWGFRFDNLGNCLGEMDVSFLPPIHFDFLSDGNLIGYYNLDDGNQLKKMTPFGKSVYSFGNFPGEFKNLIYRFEGGGLVVDDSEYIYQVNLVSPEIFKFDQNGKQLDVFVKYPKYFRKVERDLNDNNPAQVMKDIPKVLNNKTTIQNIFYYDRDKLLILLYHNRLYGIQILGTDGKYFYNDIIVDKPVLAAKNAKIYFMHQPEIKNGILPNPEVHVYEIIEDK